MSSSFDFSAPFSTSSSTTQSMRNPSKKNICPCLYVPYPVGNNFPKKRSPYVHPNLYTSLMLANQYNLS